MLIYYLKQRISYVVFNRDIRTENVYEIFDGLLETLVPEIDTYPFTLM